MAAADDLGAAIAALYGGPAEDFVASRKSLTASLRAAGQRDEAAEVAKLRKPTRTAWALDAAVAAEPEVVDQVAAAAAAMADAQGSGGDVRGAMADLRTAVGEAGHASMPTMSRNAVPILAELVRRLVAHRTRRVLIRLVAAPTRSPMRS